MKRFGTIFPFVETRDPDLKIGRHVANFGFFNALLRDGTWDEYHIFCMNATHFRHTTDTIRQRNLPAKQLRKIRLFLYDFLIPQLRTTPYTLFHLGGWGYFFPGLIHLRNQFAPSPFPITTLIHSLNGIETSFHALKCCLAPSLPFDSIICSSTAGKRVLENVFESVRSKGTSHGLSADFHGTLETIPLGIESPPDTLPSPQQCRSRLDIPIDSTVILSLGRFSPAVKMDYYPLLCMFKELCDSSPGAEYVLILAGNGSAGAIALIRKMTQELQIESKMRILPGFAASEKQFIYGAADIFISLSDNLQETFGLSVLEAQAAGLPVVVSDIDGYKETVEQGVHGFRIPTLWTGTIPYGDIADIMDFATLQLALAQCMAIDMDQAKEKIRTLIENEPLRRTMGENGKKNVQQHFSWSSLIPRYESLWDHLFERSQDSSTPPEKTPNLFLNDYAAWFTHYPTRRLKPSDSVSITARGLDCIRTRQIPTPYTDISPLLPRDSVLDCCTQIEQNVLTVKEIADYFSDTLPENTVSFMVLWMAKYGLATIKKSQD
jgi:glycosyltransferase involved in cell wall biosynthesis